MAWFPGGGRDRRRLLLPQHAPAGLCLLSNPLRSVFAPDASRVEQMLGQFTQINREMVETLDIRRINRGELLRLVAENNITLTDIINKLGVNERFDVAWKYAQYGRIWDYLRSELEMDARFRLLELKLDLVQDSLKYFLEIFQNRKV